MVLGQWASSSSSEDSRRESEHPAALAGIMAAANPFLMSLQHGGAAPSSPQQGAAPMDQLLETMGHTVSSSQLSPSSSEA